MFFRKLAAVFVFFCNVQLLGWVDIETLHTLTGVNREELVQIMRTFDGIEKEAESSWNGYYHVLPNLIRKFGLKRGIEIGVSTGGHSHALLKNTDIEKLYSIDPYTNNTTFHLSGRDYVYDVMFYRVKYRLGQYGQRSELIRAYSADVINLFKDNDFDFVFVDGSHEYEYVKKDLVLYYEKVRPGGIMAGDDYNTGFMGVPRAVNEFFNDKGVEIHLDVDQPRIWWVQKP